VIGERHLKTYSYDKSTNFLCKEQTSALFALKLCKSWELLSFSIQAMLSQKSDFSFHLLQKNKTNLFILQTLQLFDCFYRAHFSFLQSVSSLF